jgi:hypothetical protein
MMTQDIFGFRNPAAGPLSESSAGFLPVSSFKLSINPLSICHGIVVMSRPISCCPPALYYVSLFYVFSLV